MSIGLNLSKSILIKSVLIVSFVTYATCTIGGQPQLRGASGPWATPACNIRAEYFAEGECVVPPIAREVDKTWLAENRTWYVPVASEFSHFRWAETLLGRPPASKMELEKLCLMMEISQNDRGVINTTATGYTRRLAHSCSPNGQSEYTCRAFSGSQGTHPAHLGVMETYIAATDNSEYVLFVRCIDNTYKDYEVLTTAQDPSPDLLQRIRDDVVRLGFNPHRMSTLPYNTCVVKYAEEDYRPFLRQQPIFGYDRYPQSIQELDPIIQGPIRSGPAPLPPHQFTPFYHHPPPAPWGRK